MADLIDRQAVLDICQDAREEGEADVRVIIHSIRMLPAVDADPVKHGEWIVCGDGDNVPWMRSHCGKTTAHKCKVMYGNYCPNCGAKMDLEG